uniref:Putative tick transposon n=1 Tax=Amblyomma sculptum TaxID=1581419 RepID=A0A1E1XJN3_AMBSC
MHPERDRERRVARARALHKQYSEDHEVVYVDAAEYTTGSRMALAVADNNAKLLTSSSIITNSTTEAEEAAIALALVSTSATKIISDSKSAILNYVKGYISSTAARLLRFWQPRHLITLIWTPAHAGLPGNEEAHSLARGLTFRAGVEPPLRASERLLSFRDILSYYRDKRREYAPPAPSLTIPQAAHWRQLQTRTAQYPILLHARYPDQFPSSCKLCGKPGDFLHTLLTCPTFPHPPSPTAAESLPTSSSAQDQRRIISTAENLSRGGARRQTRRRNRPKSATAVKEKKEEEGSGTPTRNEPTFSIAPDINRRNGR